MTLDRGSRDTLSLRTHRIAFSDGSFAHLFPLHMLSQHVPAAPESSLVDPHLWYLRDHPNTVLSIATSPELPAYATTRIPPFTTYFFIVLRSAELSELSTRPFSCSGITTNDVRESRILPMNPRSVRLPRSPLCTLTSGFRMYSLSRLMSTLLASCRMYARASDPLHTGAARRGRGEDRPGGDP